MGKSFVLSLPFHTQNDKVHSHFLFPLLGSCRCHWRELGCERETHPTSLPPFGIHPSRNLLGIHLHRTRVWLCFSFTSTGKARRFLERASVVSCFFFFSPRPLRATKGENTRHPTLFLFLYIRCARKTIARRRTLGRVVVFWAGWVNGLYLIPNAFQSNTALLGVGYL